MFKPEMFTDLARTARDPEAAEKVAAVLNGNLDPAAVDAVDAWLRQCFNKPSHAEMVMCAIDGLLDGCGVESLRVEGAYVDRYHGDIVASYVNFGDPYITTIVLDHATGDYHVTGWGDWLEQYERELSD